MQEFDVLLVACKRLDGLAVAISSKLLDDIWKTVRLMEKSVVRKIPVSVFFTTFVRKYFGFNS